MLRRLTQSESTLSSQIVIKICRNTREILKATFFAKCNIKQRLSVFPLRRNAPQRVCFAQRYVGSAEPKGIICRVAFVRFILCVCGRGGGGQESQNVPFGTSPPL